MPKPYSTSGVPKPKIKPENLPFVKAIKDAKVKTLATGWLGAVATLLDVIADSENFYITIGCKFDRTAFSISMRDNTPNTDGSINEPIKVYGNNIEALLLALQEEFKSWEQVEEYDQANPNATDIPF